MKPTHCLRCGWKLGGDGRRRYCTYDCFVLANRAWHRKRKILQRALKPELHRTANRRYRKSEKGKTHIASYGPRNKLLWHARIEAKARGIPLADVLVEWKEPVGKVRNEKHDAR